MTQKLGVDLEDPDIRYDNRKLRISQAVQDKIYEALLQYGPKVDPSLPALCFEADKQYLVNIKLEKDKANLQAG